MVTTRENLTTKRYQGRAGGKIDLIAIHTMEAPERSQTAENIAEYFKRVNASAHWCIDDDSRVRVVRDGDTAWTLPGANSRSLNIELAGYARQTAADWADAFSLAALEIAALSAAEWCRAYGIPVRKLTDDQIRRGEKGFVGHVDISRVYKKSSHWDPGPHFPWAYFLGRVNAYLGNGGGSVVVPSNPPAESNWNNEGYNQAYIKARQQDLVNHGYRLDIDGKLGPATRAATKDFQTKNGLEADGIPGPATAEKLAGGNAPVRPAPVSPKKPDIRPLQRIMRVTADNILGPNTQRAFDAFREATWYHSPKGLRFPYGVEFTQARVGANPDGKWGPQSAAAHDKAVRQFQDALKDMGFDAGPTDGKWGPSSEAAYKAMLFASGV